MEEKAKQFCSAYNEAVDKLEELVEHHSEEFGSVENYVTEIENYSKENKRRQTGISALQLGVALVALVEPVTATLLVVGGLGKWHSKCVAKRGMTDSYNHAVNIMENDHKARHEFIEAAIRAEKARSALCEDCPHLKRMKMGYLALAATYPGLLKSIAVNAGPDAALSTALYMAEEHPETTATILVSVIEAGIAAVGVVGAELLLDTATVVIEGVPFLGVAINLESLRRAKNDQGRGTKEAEQLIEEFKKSKKHYQSMQQLMEEFQPISQSMPTEEYQSMRKLMEEFQPIIS